MVVPLHKEMKSVVQQQKNVMKDANKSIQIQLKDFAKEGYAFVIVCYLENYLSLSTSYVQYDITPYVV